MVTNTTGGMGLLLFSLLIVVGLLLAYGGYPLYTLAIFAIGAVLSVGAYSLSTTGGPTASPDIFGLLATGFVGGSYFYSSNFWRYWLPDSYSDGSSSPRWESRAMRCKCSAVSSLAAEHSNE